MTVELSAREVAEWDALNGMVRDVRPDGRYYHWNRVERDRVRELLRKRDPAIQFAPSTETMAERFGSQSLR